MIEPHNCADKTATRTKPMAMIGAGPLTSALWKSGDEHSGFRYRFNLFRQLSGTGHVSQLFRPTDLMHFVKLTRVLAAVLADDGCLKATQRASLRSLATELDEVLRRSGIEDVAYSDGTARRNSTHHYNHDTGRFNSDKS